MKLKQSRWASKAGLDDFRDKVIEASKKQPVVVDFWADWCSPCHAIAPHIGRAIDQLNGEVLLVKVEVDEGENMKLAGRYALRGFPTIMLFNHGEEVAHFAGSRATHWISQRLAEHIHP